MANNRKKFNFKNIPPRVNVVNKVVSYYEVSQYGYLGFRYYFNETDTDQVQNILKNVKIFEKYIYQNVNQNNFESIYATQSLTLDIKDLYKDSLFLEEWPDFKDDLINNPKRTLNCLSLATHQVIHKSLAEELERQVSCKIIYCRLSNYEPVLPIKCLRVNVYGKFISIKGTVIKISTSRLKCICMEFKCSYCNGTQVIEQVDGMYNGPQKCLSHGCNAKTNFQPLVDSANTITITTQIIKLLESISESSDSTSHMPRDVECEVQNDLVGLCSPGDNVILTGILSAKTATKVNKAEQSIYQLFLHVNNVQNNKTRSEALISLTVKDYHMIQKVHAQQNLFRYLVQSLCPNIYGHEIIKAGLLLALFGGTRSENRRSDSHVLMVGDPGLGKSQMLQACCNVAPRGIYVCGNSTTNAGLTVTMAKESSGEYRLEAGALVLSDQGCCCIDEFDKITRQHACLLEVMEQQTISIAKAGVTCSIPTRATVLAAANPVCGHYNRAKTVSENLKLSSPLLSRFDLVFIIMDNANEETDAFLSEHVLDVRSGTGRQLNKIGSNSNFSAKKLKDRLLLYRGEQIQCLAADDFKKYIAYAKKYVHPKLSHEAVSIIDKHYLEMRNQYHESDSTPVTARQFESLQRLTEARAKLELREIATAEDAIDVVEIMKHCIIGVVTNDVGELNFTRSQNGSGISNQKQVKRYLKLLKQKSDMYQKNTFTSKELKAFAEVLGITSEQYYSIFEAINLQGFLLKKGNNNFQFVISD